MKTLTKSNVIAACFLFFGLCSSPLLSSATDEEKAASKETNFVILNRLQDFSGNKKKIIGIYIMPATGKKLRDNPEIKWEENLISTPINYGEYAAFYIDTESKEWYDWRVDVEGVDAKGKPLQYFHSSSHLYSKGTIVHHAVVSTADGTSPWKIETKIDPDFAKK